MSGQAAFEALWFALHELRDTARALELTVVEDRPAGSEVVPVDALGVTVTDLLGTVHEAVEATADGLRAAATDPERARDALHRCHVGINETSRRLTTEVGAFARRQDLHDLARARGRDWPAWTAEVDQAMDRCQESLWTVQFVLADCWQELSRRPTATTEPIEPAGAPDA